MKDTKIHVSPNDVKPASSTIRRTPWTIFVTEFSQVESHSYSGKGTREDPYVVDWLKSDAENPLTWPKAYKWLITVAVAVALLAVTFCSSAFVSF